MNKKNSEFELRWESDEYGTSVLRLPDGAYVWLQGRRPYCDRGHWEWGSIGLPHDGDEPSHYFMTLAIAREQVERFVATRLGLDLPAPDQTHPSNGQLFDHAVGRTQDWRWVHQPNKLLAVAGQATLELSWDPKNPAAVVLIASGIDGLDSADCFPRNYIGLAAAVKEVESFLAWRLSKVPEEIPGPLNHQPLPPVLLPDSLPAPKPRRTRKP